MKIGIYTIHACNNFGALLQSYATAKFLNDNGYHAEIVNLMTTSDTNAINYKYGWKDLKSILYNIYAFLNPQVHQKISNYKKFRSLLPLSRRYYTKEEVENNPPCYDIHLVGSDQVWNLENGLKDTYYFLSFLPKEAPRISYASSFGNLEAAKKHKNSIINILSSFNYRSTREWDASDFLTNECNLKTECVLDPTFLLNSNQWGELAGISPLIKKKYILYYGFDNSQLGKDSISLLKAKFDLPIVGISVSLHSPYKFDKFYQEAGPIEFLNLIKNASFIITSSFHGVALAINFKKDFIVLKHGTRMSRIESILHTFSIENRLINNIDDLQLLLTNSININYKKINPQINLSIEQSKEWLITAVKKIE